jgi:hypothetical protein
MQGQEDLESKAIEAARRYCAGHRWTVARIWVTATVHFSGGHSVWVRATRTANGDDLTFRYTVDVQGVGTLTLL